MRIDATVVPADLLHPPAWGAGTVVVGPPDTRPGSWAGAPSVVRVGGATYLAYRLRLPLGEGRGIANVVARSEDGVTFETVAHVPSTRFDTDSLERPALVVTPAGRWLLYVSVATPGTKHWRVDVLEAATPEGLATATPRTVLPGSATAAVKDPTIVRYGGRWHLWASVHPLDEPDHTDRMTTDYATSSDAITWRWHGTVLRPRPGAWDARGVRFATVLPGRRAVAFYDGRATAGENYEERTGLAVGQWSGRSGTFGRFRAVGPVTAPWAGSPHAGHGLRYVGVLPEPGGRRRFYYEFTRADGAHDLRTLVA